MMTFSRDVVERVAKLARIRLTESESIALATDLGAILSYVEQLQQLDTSGVEPSAHCLPIQNNFRDDQRQPSLPVEDVLKNAPKRAGDFYSVPAILE
jgi:aspartyl-tRNA(Asn)/glutamyl-tRNA(Gln) amidotransferase subunit C